VSRENASAGVPQSKTLACKPCRYLSFLLVSARYAQVSSSVRRACFPSSKCMKRHTVLHATSALKTQPKAQQLFRCSPGTGKWKKPILVFPMGLISPSVEACRHYSQLI